MNLEIRSDYVVISGYVNAVERDSRIIKTPKGEFVEQVRSGTWQKAINDNEVSLLLNHNWNRKLGSNKDNLKLKEDNIGLYAEARVYDVEVIKKAKNNELSGWSFGFNVKKQSWGKTDSDVERRYLDEIKLNEVSILDKTRTPAYYGTSVENRDNEEVMSELRFIDSVELREEKQEVENKEDEEKLRLLSLELEL